jgi:hypothetical protein
MLNKIKGLFVGEDRSAKPGLFIAVFLVLTSISLLFAYCGADSTVNVPKADQYAANSNASHTQSVQAETDANNINSQSQVVEAKRQTAKSESEAATVSVRNNAENVKQRKAEYAKVRNTVPVVSADDLDARERKLLTKLRKLYWEQRQSGNR